jgi:hypothetical protein
MIVELKRLKGFNLYLLHIIPQSFHNVNKKVKNFFCNTLKMLRNKIVTRLNPFKIKV